MYIGCGNPGGKGNGLCDDSNNNAGCEFDGGDCCISEYTTLLQTCNICACLTGEDLLTLVPGGPICAKINFWYQRKTLYSYMFSGCTEDTECTRYDLSYIGACDTSVSTCVGKLSIQVKLLLCNLIHFDTQWRHLICNPL